MGQCSETSAFKTQTPGNYPKETIQHSKHGESLKSRIIQISSPRWHSLFKSQCTPKNTNNFSVTHTKQVHSTMNNHDRPVISQLPRDSLLRDSRASAWTPYLCFYPFGYSYYLNRLTQATVTALSTLRLKRTSNKLSNSVKQNDKTKVNI
jgi:hypothetical protein